MIIGFLGFGEAAKAFQQGLKAGNPDLDFVAWDILLEEVAEAEPMRQALAECGARETDPEGLCSADWLFSAVTADQSYVALQTIAPFIGQELQVIDINSVSPGRKQQSAELIIGAGGRYLDMAVMAPVHPRQHKTPVLIAGPDLEPVEKTLTDFGFDFRIVGDSPGQATAIKMVRSVFVKGLEALTVETLLAAEASGCFDEIFNSLAKSYPGLGWPDFAEYEFERTLRHGKRRAAEMRESAATVEALGLNGALVAQIAETQDMMGKLGLGKVEGDAAAIAAKVLKARLAK